MGNYEADNGNPPVGRETIFDNMSLWKTWRQIESALAKGSDDEPGWIAATVKMCFGNPRKSEATLELEDKTLLRVSIACADFARIKFLIGQQVKLSLRGAESKRNAGTSAPFSAPFSLVYKDAVAIKFITGKGGMKDGEIVDLWQKEIANEVTEPDWYSTPPVVGIIPDSGSTGLELAETPPHDLTVRQIDSAAAPANLPPPKWSVREVRNEESILNVPNDYDGNDSNVRKRPLDPEGNLEDDGYFNDGAEHQRSLAVLPTKNKPKRRKKKDTRHDPARKKACPMTSASEMIAPAPGEGGLATGSPQPSKLMVNEKKRQKKEHRQTVANTALPPSPPRRNPALELVAGCNTEGPGGAYPALGEIISTTETQVIGIVAGIEPVKTTRTQDIFMTMVLVDPSKFQHGSGFKVTCFAKPSQGLYLPAPEKGQVIILKNIKASEWHGNINGTIYPDKLKWIAFEPQSGKFSFVEQGKPEDLPFQESFTMYKPSGKEIEYCVQLGEWWRAVQEEETKGSIEIKDFTRGKREHSLIGDMDVNAFFDMTVEIVMQQEAEFGDTLFLLTDYTAHRQRSTEGPFGQFAISASTSKFEAETIARMKIGTFWSIKNVRLKIGASGHLECDLYAAKPSELSPDIHEDDVHLQALLKRKRKYEAENDNSSNGIMRSNDGAVTSISSITGAGFYNLVAELFYRSNDNDQVTDLFVTDYTNNTLLSDYQSYGLKSKLKGEPILRIGVWGERSIVREMEIGALYRFCDVQMTSDQNGAFRGKLRNADKNIKKINLRKTEDPAVSALFKRKDDFLALQDICTPSVVYEEPENNVSRLPDDIVYQKENSIALDRLRPVRSRHTDQRSSTIKEISKNNKCPNKFRLIARIVDFSPLNMRDFTARRCRNCKQIIPESRYACIPCNDMAEEFVEWVYRFFFRLEDDAGDVLDVAICDEARLFLGGLAPADLSIRENLMELKRRLRCCLGNIVEVHEGLKRKEVVEPQYGPYFDLAVKSWEITVRDKRMVVHALTGCEVVLPPAA